MSEIFDSIEIAKSAKMYVDLRCSLNEIEGGFGEMCDKLDDLVEELRKPDEKSILDFAQWYSGMEREKVLRAYKRYLKEVKGIDDAG